MLQRTAHPLGFSRVVLLRIGRLAIMMHIFPAGHTDPIIHEHKFMSVSLVVRGKLIEREFVLARAFESGDKYEILLDRAGCDELQATGKTTYMRRLRTRLIRAPGLYMVGRIHAIEVPRSRSAVTIFVKWYPRRRITSSIVLRRVTE